MTSAQQFAQHLLRLYPRQEIRRAAAPRPERYARYPADPVGYATDVLGVQLTTDQAAILASVRDHRYTCVKASHAIGKTFTAAVAVNWWYDCWLAHIAYITAPTWPQALKLTFGEVKRARRRLRLPGTILETGQVRDPAPANAGEHYIQALNAERGEGFQGEHSAPIFIVVEEAPGVPHYIFEAITGLMTHPDSRVLLIGNPTDEETDFGAAADNPTYHTFSIAALDHPNIAAELRADPPPYPKAVRLLWVREMLADECERVGTLEEDCFAWYPLAQIDRALAGQPADPSQAVACIYKPTAIFQGRVLGQFPTAASTHVIAKAWLDHVPVTPLRGLVEVGVDVARFGDDRTAIIGRQGGCVLLAEEHRQYDNLRVAEAVRTVVSGLAGQTGVVNTSIPIKIDVTGGLGTGPYDLLLDWGYHVVAVNSSETALDPDTYPNKRSELWFATREWARTKTLDLSRLPAETRKRLIRELGTPTWKPDAKGRKVVEPKAETKKRLGASPDLADACNLAFAPYADQGVPASAGARAPALGWRTR